MSLSGNCKNPSPSGEGFISLLKAEFCAQFLLVFRELRLEVLIKGYGVSRADLLARFLQASDERFQKGAGKGKDHLIIRGHIPHNLYAQDLADSMSAKRVIMIFWAWGEPAP